MLADLGALDRDGRDGNRRAPARPATAAAARPGQSPPEPARAGPPPTSRPCWWSVGSGDGLDLDERVERFRRDRGQRAADMRRLADGWARIAGAGRPAESEPAAAGPLLALAYPDRVARARGREGEFVMASGRAGRLDPASALARETYLVIPDLAGSAGNARILAAAAIGTEAIERLFADRIESRTEITFDPQAAALRARRSGGWAP